MAKQKLPVKTNPIQQRPFPYGQNISMSGNYEQNLANAQDRAEGKTGWDKFKKGAKEFFVGKPSSTENVRLFEPQQDLARQQLLQQAMQGLGNQPQFNAKGGIDQILQMLLGGQGQIGQPNPTLGVNPQSQQLLQQTLKGSKTPQGYGFEPIEQLARQQFQQETVPSIAHRFTSMDGKRSSAFNRQLASASTDLDRQLAALRYQYGMQERQQLGQEQGQRQNLLSSLLGYGLQGRQQDTRENLAQQNLLQMLLGTQGQQQGQQQNLLLSLLGQGLQSPFTPMYQPATGGVLGGLSNFGGQAAGTLGSLGLKYALGA